ncbi:monooxygenase [Tothia fuscella]|uniref:Monooxygenase n=1 Tax=Tothia fuscella TaxID=1048955 RepID=A0A9P4U0W1_9PEZI|nr:monooxygenase [Tothia fuscella]
MSDKGLHVIIVGAGLAGLATAHGLKTNNISHVIVDRESGPRDRNWGVTISWAHPLMKKLLPDDLYANLQSCQPDISMDTKAAGKECILIRDGASGETKIEAHFPGVRRMQIQKTKKAWAVGLNIKYGKKLSNITTTDDGVTAHFEDGTEESGSVIIGADGGTSSVRKWLLGDLATSEVLPYAFMNFPFTLKTEQALWLDKIMNPNVDVATHPKSMYLGLFLLDKPDLSRPETWIFYILVTWPIKTEEDKENSGDRLKRLRDHMDGWADPYKSVVEWVPHDVEIKPDWLRIWHPKPWDNHGGRVTLAGDAAHSMTFHRGQGGNLAIKDADEFVTAMIDVRDGKTTLKEAMDKYDVGVVERGQEVEISKKQALAFHDYANFDNSPVMKMGIKAAGT